MPSDLSSASGPHGLCLLVVSEGGYSSYRLDTGETISLGRSDEVDIRIDDPSVSRRHATLTVGEDTRLTICDLDSGNGVRVLGRRIASNHATRFNAGEAVMLGSALLLVQDVATAARISVLPRMYFEARLAEECRASARTNRAFTLFDLNVDGEGMDTFEALSSRLRLSDAVGNARPNGWFVLMRDINSRQAPEIAQRLTDKLAAVGAAARIGHATWPKDGRTPQQLIEVARPATPSDASNVFYGDSMRPLLATVDQIASSPISVLITGETGVGKELIAERIHRGSGRTGPFLRLNCAAISPELISSELFGHVRGAFTGAEKDKQGLLEVAADGTFFLDEIGELTLPMQVQLLRVLEERTVRRVGAVVSVPINVRFVAATNQDLARAIEDGRFRRDLYYRLSGSVVHLPPLRERRDEIVPLAQLFLRLVAAQAETPALEVAEGSRRVLQTYSWPGNVRELRNIIERAAVLCDGDTVLPRHFPVEQMQVEARLSISPTEDRMFAEPDPTELQPASDADEERERISVALARHGGNQGLAADELKISRRTLMRRMDSLRIPRPRKR